MTKQELKYLSQFEDNFYTAIQSSFSRNISRSSLEEMNRIYEKETGKTQNINYNCSVCCLTLIKKVADIYYKEKNKKKKEE